MEVPADKVKVLFFHVGKAGGGTVYNMLKKTYGERNVFQVHQRKVQKDEFQAKRLVRAVLLNWVEMRSIELGLV